MRTRWISALVAVGLVCAATAISAQASSPRTGTPTLRPSAVSKVYGSSVTRGRITRGSISVGAVFAVPGAKRVPAMRAADAASECANDGSGSVSTCLTQKFLSCQIGGITGVELLGYVERWRDLDPNNQLVQLTGPAGIRAQVTGITDANQCGGPTHAYPDTVQLKKIGHPHYGRYKFHPSWSGTKGGYVAISGPASQCANSFVELQRYSERWKLQTPNVCQGTFWTPSP